MPTPTSPTPQPVVPVPPVEPPSLPVRKRFNSQALFGSEREVEIEHAGQLYRLRQTALGKLILTK